MKITLRKAELCDSKHISNIYYHAIQVMNDMGINQWDNIYPNEEILYEDIKKQHMFLGETDSQIASIVVLNNEYDKEYEAAAWKYKDLSFSVVHRLCVNPVFQGKGVGRQTMLLVEEMLLSEGIETIRLDAFSLNPIAVKMYKKLGYLKVGEVIWRKGLFYLFEKKLINGEQ